MPLALHIYVALSLQATRRVIWRGGRLSNVRHWRQAITGHRSLQEVRRYTQAASQLVLARRAMKAIPSPNAERKLATHLKRLAKKRSK